MRRSDYLRRLGHEPRVEVREGPKGPIQVCIDPVPARWVEWPTDPTAKSKRSWPGGKRPVGTPLGNPPPGDERQCAASKTGRMPAVRCKRWSIDGLPYCEVHAVRKYGRVAGSGGDAARAAYEADRGKGGSVAVARASWYTAKAGLRLRSVLEELAKQSPSERHSLQEEVDLSRALTERALRLFEAACYPDDAGKVASAETQAAAIGAMQNALDRVSDTVVRAARVRETSLDVVDSEQLGYVVNKVMEIVEEEVAQVDRALADRIVQRLDEIKMPERRKNTTGAAVAAEEAARLFRTAAEALESSVPPGPPGPPGPPEPEAGPIDKDAAGEAP